mgnify:CR=1 FL=1
MLNIIFEDNHVLVIEKPVNIPSQEDLTGDMDVLSMCKAYLKKKYQKPGNVFCGLVHRLDRPVGGLMVFAKTSKAASRLSDQIRSKKMKKKYIALVEHTVQKDSATLKHYLKKNKSKNITEVQAKPFADAKEAILNYQVLKNDKLSTFVEIELITGRSHQIRSQFSFIGHPLFGDKKYKATQPFKEKGIALFSSYLSFKHPTKEEVLEFSLTPSWF